MTGAPVAGDVTPMARRVLLMTNEPATASAVGTGLESNGRLANEDVCRDFAELSSKLRDSRAQAALVDIDQPGALANLETLARHFADTRFVVLSSTMDSQRVLDSMQAGARHYLLKSAIASDLSGVLHRICPNGLAGRSGAVFTILSAGGGAGCTTLAVNLAHELSLLLSSDSGRALVVDLDTCYGAIGPYLGVDTEYGIVDLLARSGPIDNQLIETASLPFGERMRVLVATAAARLGEAGPFDPARLSAAVSACAGAGPVTVIDAPRLPIVAAQELVRDSDATLLLMQLSVKDVRTARRMLAHLMPAGGPSAPGAGGSVIPIVSRYAKRGTMITLAEAKQALGNIELRTLCNDWTAASQSLNLGKPLAQTAAKSELRREIQQLAGRLASVHMKQSVPAAAAGAKR
jgi:Flp pilus assembly CpaE family ATPase